MNKCKIQNPADLSLFIIFVYANTYYFLLRFCKIIEYIIANI
jgi:hypothetical protein